MTKSLGGLALAASTVISGGSGLMNHSTTSKTAENGSSGSAGGGAGGAGNNGMVDMSKSLASFHLSSSAITTAGGGGSSGIGNGANGNNQTSNSTRNRAMDESVDHLFKEGKTIFIITDSYYTPPRTARISGLKS